MTRDAYRTPPNEVDMAVQEHVIRRDASIAFAALCWSIPGFVLLVAISMVSTTRRYSPQDIGGQAAGPPSDRLAIKAAFLQNTLEQTVLAAGFYFGLAAIAGGAWMGLLPVAAILFVIGRALFYAGYRRGATGRALGMGLTMMPSVLGYLLIAALAAMSVFGG